MFRQILIPGAIIIVCAIGASGFSLWDVFHRQFQAPWNPEQAYTGNIATQRRLASCYMTGCPKIPRDPAFGCAWRKIIMDERTPASVIDVAAERKACSDLSTSDKNWLPKLESDIRFQSVRSEREGGYGKGLYIRTKPAPTQRYRKASIHRAYPARSSARIA